MSNAYNLSQKTVAGVEYKLTFYLITYLLSTVVRRHQTPIDVTY